MAEIIGYDPITGDPIWDDETLNTPAPEGLPTQDNNPIITQPPVPYDTAVYMTSTLPAPEPGTLPDTTHQGIQLTDREVWELVDATRWYLSGLYNSSRQSAVVLLNVDDADDAKAPIYKVDLSVTPIDISSARS